MIRQLEYILEIIFLQVLFEMNKLSIRTFSFLYFALNPTFSCMFYCCSYHYPFPHTDVYTNYPQCTSLISGNGNHLCKLVGSFAFAVAGICCGLLNSTL